MFISKVPATPVTHVIYEPSDVTVHQLGENDFLLRVGQDTISDFYPTAEEAASHISERVAVYNELINNPAISAQLQMANMYIKAYESKSSVGQHTGEWREGFIEGLKLMRPLLIWGSITPMDWEYDPNDVITENVITETEEIQNNTENE